MATQVNALPPSLVGELRDLQRRITALERKPEILAKFDRYPITDGAATPRDRETDNKWASCGVADVTGLVYDRVECRFTTDRMITGKAEAELRLAAFRYLATGERECVSASRSVIIHGTATRALCTADFRWIHGIPHGWDYEDGTAIYTIELQHRYKVGPTPVPPQIVPEVYGFWKMPGTPEPSSVAAELTPGFYFPGLGADAVDVHYGWVKFPQPVPDYGTYNISSMHYCVGLPAARLPDATVDGLFGYSGPAGSFEPGTAGNINDPTL